MSDVLARIKRAVLAGRYAFSEKARLEMKVDRITEQDVVESLLSASAIHKRIRSTSLHRERRREYLYIIQSTNFDGLPIYTKGKFTRSGETETFYLLISSKRVL